MAQQYKIRPTKLVQLEGHRDAVYDFALDKELQHIYSCSADGHLVKWDWGSIDGTLVLQAAESFFSIHLNEGILYAGTMQGAIYQVDLTKAVLLSQNQHHAGAVFCMLHVAGELLSGGEDGVLRWGDSSMLLSSSSLRCMVQDERNVYIGSSDGLIYVLSKASKQVVYKLIGHKASVFGLSTLDNQRLLSTGRDAKIIMWDLLSFKPILEVPAHDYQAKSLSYNGQFVLSCSMDKSIKLWTGELDLLKVIDHARNASHTNCINKVEWMNESVFVSCSDDRSLMVWQIEYND